MLRGTYRQDSQKFDRRTTAAKRQILLQNRILDIKFDFSNPKRPQCFHLKSGWREPSVALMPALRFPEPFYKYFSAAATAKRSQRSLYSWPL